MAQWKRVITGVAEALDKIDDYNSNFFEVRDEVVAVFKGDPAYDFTGIDDFNDAVRELEEAENREDFDFALNEIYDWADRERVWIDPRPRQSA